MVSHSLCLTLVGLNLISLYHSVGDLNTQNRHSMPGDLSTSILYYESRQVSFNLHSVLIIEDLYLSTSFSEKTPALRQAHDASHHQAFAVH